MPSSKRTRCGKSASATNEREKSPAEAGLEGIAETQSYERRNRKIAAPTSARARRASIDGDRVGTTAAAGLIVGVRVGVLLGGSVGVMVGVLVGVKVGVFVGVLVGVFVGTPVGVFVGVFVGVL